MKAVILERKGDEAAVLAENGTFMKVRRSGGIGEEIEIGAKLTPVPGLKQRWIKGLAAAALVLVAAGGAYHYTAVSVSAYVSIDAGDNSVELSVNRLGRVVSVTNVTGSDSRLAETISSDIRGMKIEDAVPAALEMIAEESKMQEPADTIIIGITSESDSSAESLENSIAQSVDRPVYTVMVSEEERNEAHRQELGGGIYVYSREETADAADDIEPEEIPDIGAPVTAAADNTDSTPVTSAQPEETTAPDVPREPSPTADNTAGPQRNIQQAADNPPQMPADIGETTEPPAERDFGYNNGEPSEPGDADHDEIPYTPDSDVQPVQTDPQSEPAFAAAPQQPGEQLPDAAPRQPDAPFQDAAAPAHQSGGERAGEPGRMQTPTQPNGFTEQAPGMSMPAPAENGQGNSGMIG